MRYQIIMASDINYELDVCRVLKQVYSLHLRIRPTNAHRKNMLYHILLITYMF
jgi:hypothetical protein